MNSRFPNQHIGMLRRMVPVPVKRWVHSKLNSARSSLKTPRMVYGYRDSNGNWRPKTRVSDTALLSHRERISLADNVFVGHYTILDGTGGLTIGEGTQLAAYVGIFSHSSHISIRLYGRHYQDIRECEKTGYLAESVTIGKYVFLGARATILPGVTIGDGALIAADSRVSEDVPNFAIVSGSPARMLGDTRDLDAAYLSDPQLKTWYEEWQT